MKLTIKDKGFLSILSRLLQDEQLRVTLEDDGIKRMVLRQNYGSQIEKEFGVTRQGVRWRFNHVFNEIYVSAYTAIMMIESAFGTSLRKNALAIAKQRVELREKSREMQNIHLPRRETDSKPTAEPGVEL